MLNILWNDCINIIKCKDYIYYFMDKYHHVKSIIIGLITKCDKERMYCFFSLFCKHLFYDFIF